jgi:hypothetical protein
MLGEVIVNVWWTRFGDGKGGGWVGIGDVSELELGEVEGVGCWMVMTPVRWRWTGAVLTVSRRR